jgi:hypothetical protein
MITASDFLKWLEIFNVNFGGNVITIPVSIAQGGTGVTSVTIVPTANMWAGWDSHRDLSANNFISGYNTTVTAAGTTTLTVGSTFQQFFTGTTTQTVLLPVTSTLVDGQSFFIVNNSTGVVTVESSGANTIQAMAAGTTLIVTCISTSGTTAASWSASYNAQNTLGIFLRLTGGTMSGAINMGSQSITNLTNPVNPQDAMTLNYAGLTYLALAGGTMTGAINMGANKIDNMADPTLAQDAMTLNYAGGHYLALAGGTMSGSINMNSNSITSLLNPVNPQDAVTLSYLQTYTGSYLPLAGGTMSGTINMGSNFITNLLDPINAQDAATKNYVNNVAAGLSPIPGVYAASTANLTGYIYLNGTAGVGATLTAPSNGVFIVDGVSPSVGTRFLYKNDTTYTGTANGIYTVTVSTSGSPAVLTRATDYNTPSDISAGDLVSVESGTANQNSSWYQTATVVTIGTSPIAFSVFFNPSSYVSSALNSANIFVGNGSNIATGVPVSGDLTLLNTGAFTVSAINGVALGSTTATSGNVLIGNGSSWVTHAISGDATLSSTGAITVSSIGGKGITLANSFTTSGNFPVIQTYTGPTNVTFPTSGTLATTSQLPTSAALTESNDTNVTLTLGGTPSTALLQAVSLTLGWTGQLAVSRGGSGAGTLTGLLTGNGTSAFTGTSITQYNILSGGATNLPNSIAPSATSGVPLISQGSASQPIFGTALVAGGGTGATSFNTNGVVISNTSGTGVLAALSLSDGQIVIGSSAGAPTATTLTAGTNITITNGHNTITINSTAVGTTNVNQNTSSATLAPNTRYITNNGASLVTYTLATSPAIGDTYFIVGGSSGGWSIAQNVSQQINYGNVSTTAGTGGSLSSSNQNNCVTITYVGSNIFTAYETQGNLNYV